MTKILIADDHKLVREGLRMLLTQTAADIEIAGEATTGKQVLCMLENTPVDLVLMDLDMPEINGIEVTRQIRKLFPQVKVLMLTMADKESWVKEAIRAGVQGYLLKTAGCKELLCAIRTLAEGKEFFSPELTRMLLGKTSNSAAPGIAAMVGSERASSQALPVSISAREMQVLQLIAQGYTNQQIGDMLFTSKRTVESHRQNLLEKTGSKNTAILIRYALKHGLIS